MNKTLLLLGILACEVVHILRLRRGPLDDGVLIVGPW